MATPPEDADDYNQLVARIAGLSQENTNIENFAFSVTPSASSDDLFAQLQQKELDLKLTAELGKALLDKNEDLQRRNEQLVEEYSQRLEELTQEKHELRLRLEAIEGQYELTVRELQHEVTQLRDDLADQDETMRVGERTHTQELQDAKQHNEQLSEQVHKVRGSEAELQGQVGELREQLRTRRISMQDYLHKVEALREEIGKLTAVRVELEQRINILTSERNMHVCSLEDMHDRIVALERHKQEQEEQLMCQEREINELREQNLCLQDNVGHLTLQSTSDLTLEAGGCSNSLFRELHLSNTKSTSTESLDADAFSRKSVDFNPFQLRQEIVEVYKLMKQMVNDLEDGVVHQGHNTPSDSPQVEPQLALAEVLTGGLQSLLRKLHQQMEHAVNIRVNQLMRPTMEKLQHLEPLERKVQELQNELDAALVALNDFNYQAHQSTSTSDLTAEVDGDDSLLSATKTTSTESLDTDAFSQRTTCLTHEVVEVYQQMKQMVNDLGGGEVGHGHSTHLSSQVEPQQALSEVQSGVLQSLLRKLREQMEHAVNIRVNQLMQPTPEQLRHNEGLEQKVEQLQNELTRAEAADNKLKVELKLREMELKRKSDEFMQLTSEIKLSLQQQELVTLQIERDRLQDQSAGVITRDDIIEQARQSRDDAISRRNAMEVELARAKLDLMNLDRQLMDAIQQKLQLSQQLEQWQMDMQELVDTQMMKRMELESKKVERSRGGPQSALRKFKFSWS